MCIIAVSKKGVRQPTLEQLHNMYENNPDGAGFMYAREGQVHIHKGFMVWEDFEREIKKQAFTENDPVVYHFRISTQAGVKPTMTHPFPLTTSLQLCEALDLTCPVGVAHNGIIHMTSFAKETRYSDTAYFICWYMTRLIREHDDITDPAVIDMIENLTTSKWAILDGATGDIETVGKFTDVNGLLFSNTTYIKYIPAKKYGGYGAYGATGYYRWDGKDFVWVDYDYKGKGKKSKATKGNVKGKGDQTATQLSVINDDSTKLPWETDEYQCEGYTHYIEGIRETSEWR